MDREEDTASESDLTEIASNWPHLTSVQRAQVLNHVRGLLAPRVRKVKEVQPVQPVESFPKYKPIGPWNVIGVLSDEGGNSTVYLAQRGDEPERALKVLNETNRREVTYQRFQDEVKLLRRLGRRPGILWAVDADPKAERPWLAMPVAMPIRRALDSGLQPPLETVVEALAAIADTLATLATKNIHHRDIKPSNLFRLDDQWVVGDFGLASFPDKPELTTSARPIGARNYTADEMIADPAHAAAGPADVFSLAKTLWVLATGQTWPPQGHQRTDIRSETMEDYVDDPRRCQLDKLIEASTHRDPKARPSMAAFAQELRTWLTPPPIPVDPEDISDFAMRFQILTEPQRRTQHALWQQEQQQRELLSRLERRVRFLVEDITQTLSPSLAGQVGQSNALLHCCPGANRPGHKQVWSMGASFTVHVQLPDPYTIYLCSGFGVELFDDMQLCIIAAHTVRMYADINNPDNIVWAATSLIPMGLTGLEEHVLDELAEGLKQNRRLLLERLETLFTTALANVQKSRSG